MPHNLESNPILLVHRKSSQPFSEFQTSVPIWKTCLRQIAFIQKEQLEFLNGTLPEVAPGNRSGIAIGPANTPVTTDRVLQNYEALHFLLRVLCGLESPVLGETEVMGQFKNFLQQIPSSPHALLNPQSRWHQILLSEVKSLRENHVRFLGSQSYGSLLRKELKNHSQLALLGSGIFISELLPWLKDKIQIDLWCRRTEKGMALKPMHPGLRVFPLQNLTPAYENQALVIAAPIPNGELIALLSKKWDLIIDLRGETHLIFPPNLENFCHRYLNLEELTKTLQTGQEERNLKLQNLINLIDERVLGHFDRPRIRPLGWEDLCA